MRRGRCPKCGAAEVHGSRGNFSWGAEQGVRIKTSPMVRGSLVDTYRLSEVAQTWSRVEPHPDNGPHVAP